MGVGRNWSKEDVNFLEDKWGVVSIPYIAKKLNRSINAIREKANRLGLDSFINNGDYVTLHQLIQAIGQGQNYSYLNERLGREGFPIRYKRVIDKKYKIVYLNEFWEWAEKNQTKLDFSKFEKNMLGAEPSWVDRKRGNDIKLKRHYKTTPWTKKEDKRLEELLNKYKYSYRELAKMLRRTEGAISRRMCDLGLIARPIKADNHIKWTLEEVEKLKELILERCSYNLMSDILNKSTKAIKGKVYRDYGTENIDKVVFLINEVS